jgi:two-component system, NtrC family, response regulator GlrR
MTAPTTSPPTAQLAGLAPPTVRAVRLEVLRGPDAGLSRRYEQERIVIGSHRTADVVLSDPAASRFHCELVIAHDVLLLRDLGSKNGTVVETLELREARVRGPTMITVGQSELRIELLADATPIALSDGERFGGLVGASPVMRATFARLERAAARDHHVVIEGERGTGKDAAAVALHELGPRRDAPFDVVDCGASPLEVEALLFGRRERQGVLATCSGGTVVLDDIGALGRNAQRILVRALEERCVRRADAAPAPFDTRIIALSRGDLWGEVNREQMRPDLLDVLAVATVRLPPLREHPEDIPLLVTHFLAAAGATGTPADAFLRAPESIERMRASAWPGNVRELRAHVEHVIATGESTSDTSPSVPLVDSALPLREARRRWIAHFERAYLEDLLDRTGGNVSVAASRAGVDRVHLHRMITQAGLRDELERRRKS